MSKNVEVEVRILLKNKKRVLKKLELLGARVCYFSHLIDYWFCRDEAKDYHQASLDRSGFALRIRESKDDYTGKTVASLECKTLSDGKNHALCHEHEINIENVGETRKILDDIGLKEFLVIDKERIMYSLGKMKFCFDDIRGLGDGLEIEMMVPKNKTKKAHQEILKFAAALGIKKEEILDKSLTYLAMRKIARF